MKSKYPIKKYILPWSLLAINTFTLIRLGNLAFTILAVYMTLTLYLILRLAARQIDKKDEEIESLKKQISLKS